MLFLTYMRICTKLLQLCPTLFDPIDCSPPASSVLGILQEKIQRSHFGPAFFLTVSGLSRDTWDFVGACLSLVVGWGLQSVQAQ